MHTVHTTHIFNVAVFEDYAYIFSIALLNVETIVPAIEKLFQVQFMAADVYYISELPSKLVWSDVYAIAGMAFLLSLLATIYPAWQASRINPAEVLRYE